jgi:hypothetical protein
MTESFTCKCDWLSPVELCNGEFHVVFAQALFGVGEELAPGCIVEAVITPVGALWVGGGYLGSPIPMGAPGTADEQVGVSAPLRVYTDQAQVPLAKLVTSSRGICN